MFSSRFRIRPLFCSWCRIDGNIFSKQQQQQQQQYPMAINGQWMELQQNLVSASTKCNYWTSTLIRPLCSIDLACCLAPQ